MFWRLPLFKPQKICLMQKMVRSKKLSKILAYDNFLDILVFTYLMKGTPLDPSLLPKSMDHKLFLQPTCVMTNTQKFNTKMFNVIRICCNMYDTQLFTIHVKLILVVWISLLIFISLIISSRLICLLRSILYIVYLFEDMAPPLVDMFARSA